MSEIDTYVDVISKEYNQKLDIAGIKKFSNIKQIHWGGGTPTFMTMKQIENAYKAIEKRANIDNSNERSISIEAYPDDEVITIEKLKLLKTLGFNEISFGVQDFDDRIQKVINRDCNLKIVNKLIDQAREIGFKVHIDLCYGLPFQGQNEFERTVKEVIRMAPDRIAVFPYAHYPLLYPLQRQIPNSSIPNSFIKVLLAKIANDYFLESGYGRVGSDHFIKKENLLFEQASKKIVERDFMGYSVDARKQFIGFGNSAISFLNDTLFHNLIHMDEYSNAVNAGGIAINKSMSYTLNDDDHIRKNVMLKHILTDMEIDKEQVERKFGITFDRYFQREMELLKDLENDGLIEMGPSKIKITNIGVYFSRHVAHVFDTYYKK